MVYYLDRETRRVQYEPVWGRSTIEFLYKKSQCLGWAQNCLRHLISIPFFSTVWGYIHDLAWSRKRIRPFCEKFSLDLSSCEKPLDQFKSFNDFFTRKLKSDARPLSMGSDDVLMPADARYTFIENLSPHTHFLVKGSQFNLVQFLQSKELACRLYGGTLILARLCPLDCHRFYFPFDGEAESTHLIEGPLFSVNPIATKEHPWIFWTNRRTRTVVHTTHGMCYVMAEIGATNCGTIIQTFKPGKIQKGEEKGYFKLGGSALALFFEKGTLELAQDLRDLSGQGLEVYCKIGQKLGTTKRENCSTI